MPIASLQSQVDQVQSLLNRLQDDLNTVPFDVQNQVLQNLEQVVADFRETFQTNTTPINTSAFDAAQANFKSRSSASSRTSEDWVHHALRQGHSGAWKWDLIHHKVQLSLEMYALLGCEPEDDISDPQTLIDMIHPEERAEKTRRMEEALKRGGPFIIEFPVKCKDGRTLWISSARTVDHDPSGRPVQAAGISQDISARKQIENALGNAEERERAKVAELEALMDAVPAMIWISRDPQCKEMVGNQHGYKFLEMWAGSNISKTAPDPDLAQQPYRNFKDGKEIPISELPMQVAAATGVGTSNYEFDLVFQNGVTKNLLGNVVPLQDPQGSAYGAVAVFVDITERKRMEEELRCNEAELRRWREQINIWNRATGSFFWNLEQDGSYHNEGLTDSYVTGKTFDQVREWKWFDTIHPNDREQLRHQWQHAIQHKTLFSVEARVWHEASNQYRWYRHQAVPILEEGVLKEWVGVSSDVQAHRELIQALTDREAEIRRSEANERAKAVELQAILDAIPTPILLAHDPAANVISGNLAACKFLGVRPGENLVKVLLGEEASYVEEVFQDGVMLPPEKLPLQISLRTGKAVNDFVSTVLLKDGSQKVLLGNAIPLRDEIGNLTGAVGVYVDVTERISATRALRQSEHRFRVAIASAPLTVFTLDRDLRYTWVYNARHTLSDNTIIGKRGDEILPAEDVKEFTELKQYAIKTGKAVQKEIKIKINHTWLNHIASLEPIFDHQGQLTGLIGATLDVTEQRQLEAIQHEKDIRMAAQSQLLETREKERMKLARDIHDGPIQSIVGAIFHVQDVKDRISDGDGKNDLEPVQTSLKNTVHELRQIINELRPPLLDRFGLAKAIHKLVLNMHEKNPEIVFFLDLPDDLGKLSEQVSVTLFRICQEALSNIYRHSEATQFIIRLSLYNDQITLTVQDNGRGFDNRIDFNALSENSHFGLVGMKERAEALGGNFFVTSTKTDGTTIKVILPKNPSIKV